MGYIVALSIRHKDQTAGADPGFLEKGFIYINVMGFALLILSHFP